MLITLGIVVATGAFVLLAMRAAHARLLLVGGSARKYLAFAVALAAVLVVVHMQFPQARGAVPLGLAIGLLLVHWGVVVAVVFSALGLLGEMSIPKLLREKRQALTQYGVPADEIPLASFAEAVPFLVLAGLTAFTLIGQA